MKDAVQGLRSLATQMWPWSAPRSTGESRAHPPICDDIQAWCADRHEGEYRVLNPASLIIRHPPRTLESQIHPSFEPLYRVEVPPRALVRVAGARLVGENGLVVLPDGSFVGELVALTEPGRRAILAEQSVYRESLPRKITRKRGGYYPLFALGWTNYYHWNHDVIMRTSRIMDDLPSDIRFVAPPRVKPFQKETLQLLGIETSRLETFDGGGVWEFESLFFSTPVWKTQIDTGEPMEWFKNATLARYQIPPPRQHRRLYLSRRLDHHWRTANEPEVEALLHAYGFETVMPGTLSFRDQAALFAEADMLVGTGAGLNGNLVFAPRGARILQLQEPSHVVHSLWTMAESLGHRYWYVMGEAVPNPGQHADIFVPLDKLQQTLNVMLSDTTREQDAYR